MSDPRPSGDCALARCPSRSIHTRTPAPSASAPRSVARLPRARSSTASPSASVPPDTDPQMRTSGRRTSVSRRSSTPASTPASFRVGAIFGTTVASSYSNAFCPASTRGGMTSRYSVGFTSYFGSVTATGAWAADRRGSGDEQEAGRTSYHASDQGSIPPADGTETDLS